MSSESYIKREPRIPTPSNTRLYYKFVSQETFIYDDVYEARILDISSQGAQVCVELPSLRLLKLLGDENLYIGCNIQADGELIKSLARARWARSTPDESKNCHRMGLEFINITPENQLKLKKFLIHCQMPQARCTKRADLFSD